MSYAARFALLFLVASLNAAEAVPITDARLDNAHRLTEKVITGAEPSGEAAFQALKELGVKTIITVDGAKPDVETARKFGLRYVHLPIGYDGVPPERSAEIAKAITELDGPIYVHCHHGKHRGPAAAATACVVAGLLSNNEAVAAMKVLGTGENYLGLWASARNAKAMPVGELAKVKVEYREISPIPPLAEAMVHVDQTAEQIAECQKAGWKTPKDHPDLEPAHEALKLRELFFELTRTEEFKTRPDDFQKWLKGAAENAGKLEEKLNAAKKDGKVAAKEIDAAFTTLRNDCNACHKVYRNKKP
ncbi:MAG TPA: hypothetical protein VKX17_03440 [Planctomycetota bacterium]|nr:hypothetical protein [Planctomycetota bacterium]